MSVTTTSNGKTKMQKKICAEAAVRHKQAFNN